MIKTNHIRTKTKTIRCGEGNEHTVVVTIEQFWEMETHESITNAVWHSDTLSYGIWKEVPIHD
jgi:hypothetical protein